jgi:hypothetical protein
MFAAEQVGEASLLPGSKKHNRAWAILEKSWLADAVQAELSEGWFAGIPQATYPGGRFLNNANEDSIKYEHTIPD